MYNVFGACGRRGGDILFDFYIKPKNKVKFKKQNKNSVTRSKTILPILGA